QHGSPYWFVMDESGNSCHWYIYRISSTQCCLVIISQKGSALAIDCYGHSWICRCLLYGSYLHPLPGRTVEFSEYIYVVLWNNTYFGCNPSRNFINYKFI